MQALPRWGGHGTGNGSGTPRSPSRRSRSRPSFSLPSSRATQYSSRAGPPYRLLAEAEAARRVGAALETALDRLPQDHGILPHFADSAQVSERSFECSPAI